MTNRLTLTAEGLPYIGHSRAISLISKLNSERVDVLFIEGRGALHIIALCNAKAQSFVELREANLNRQPETDMGG